MMLDDVNYFARRALSQLECADRAVDDGISRVHTRLSDLYLERARASLMKETSKGECGNVLAMRIVA